MAVAIEDAGFEVRDMIEWVYGSGFPKSLNIGKAVDKLQGNEREVIGEYQVTSDFTDHKGSMMSVENSGGKNKSTTVNATKGTSEWEGWGTALKPAHEPICMARKPLAEKTVAENVLKYGTGGINIDESRVAHQSEADRLSATPQGKATGKSGALAGQTQHDGERAEFDRPDTTLGRFPANLIHDNSEEVRECFPNESERFFKSIIYTAKASKSERNKGCEELELREIYPQNNSLERKELNATANKRVQNNHPTVKPIALMEYIIKMVTPKGGIVLDPFMGSGSTGVAAKQNGYDFIGIDMTPEYVEIAKARMEAVIQQPTIV